MSQLNLYAKLSHSHDSGEHQRSRAKLKNNNRSRKNIHVSDYSELYPIATLKQMKQARSP